MNRYFSKLFSFVPPRLGEAVDCDCLWNYAIRTSPNLRYVRTKQVTNAGKRVVDVLR